MEQMTYQGTVVEDIIRESFPASNSGPLLFLMGPYRLLDPTYLYPQTDHGLPDDPLAPAEDAPQPDLIKEVLRGVAERVTEQTQVTAFIASDIDIPTIQEVEDKDLDEPGMPVIDQSVAAAQASAGSAFVFTKAGLTTGVGAEAGAIPEHFRLRDPESAVRNPKTFCILAEGEQNEAGEYGARFSSASIDEMDIAYRLRFRYFENREQLVERLIAFVDSYVVPLYGED